MIEIVNMQQMLKKWKKFTAVAPKSSSCSSNKKNIKLARDVPKGSLAVYVGKEMKRFVIPTEYLSHRAFRILLRQAEEEFGFQQEGALRIPSEVSVFENILRLVQGKKETRNLCSVVAHQRLS